MTSDDFIPYGRQAIDDDDVAAVVAVLKGDWLTQGPTVEAFERSLCETTNAEHAVAFSSGTAALHGAAAAAGLGPGDRVGVPALTFTATAASACYVHATPVLLDISEETFNIDIPAIPSALDALVAVHYAGLPADLAALPYRPRIVIEDAAHALGARTPDGPVGNCARSDMCCFSFHPVKPITTTEGGAVTTNDAVLAERLRAFRSHGIARPPGNDPWYYEVRSLGFNYRLSDVACALGLSQLRKLGRYIDRRNELADRYRALLADSAVQLPPPAAKGWRHGYHLFAVRVPNRRYVFEELRRRGIGVQVHYVPLHHHPVYSNLERPLRGLPTTEAVYAGLISLPMHATLTDTDQDRVVEALRELIAR